MLSINDLHFKSEIVPLFDHVYNERSRDTLLQLLTQRPGSVEEIYTRQAILKGMMAHDHLYRPFSYTRAVFQEVYQYINELNTREIGNLLFARTRRAREIGQLSQLYVFFYKIDQAYIHLIKPGEFPEEFRGRLENIRRTFAGLELAKYYGILRKRSFRLAEISYLTGLISQKNRTGEMETFWQDFFLFEAWLSISKGIVKNKFTFPAFIPDGLSIDGFYHPLIKNPTLNSIRVRENVVLITGPNMSGKSTLLKSIGLCVSLAHLGLAVPAERCELAFFDVISISINLNDDILSGYSHFMTEIINLKKVVEAAGHNQRCFAIFDELFRGTNVEDALAISKTTIEGLTHFRHSCFFISTHLHQLKESALNNSHISTRYIECRLVHNRPVFTYNLREGWSDLRIGQIIFEQEGLNDLLKHPHFPSDASIKDQIGFPC